MVFDSDDFANIETCLAVSATVIRAWPALPDVSAWCAGGRWLTHMHVSQPVKWNEFASTFVPPFPGDGRDIAALLDFTAELPESGQLQVPSCRPFLPDASMATMDHVYGIAHRYSPELSAKYTPELGLKEFLRHMFEVDLPVGNFGHRVAEAMASSPTFWALHALAALYWRIVGNASEGLDCVRLALHHSEYNRKDVALVNGANILHRAGFLSNATILAHLALTVAQTQRSIVHFMLGNVLAAQGYFLEAESHYESALRYQSKFSLAGLALQRLRCIRLYPSLEAVQGPHSDSGDAHGFEDRLARHRAELQKHILEAMELRERLNQLKILVEQHGAGPETASLRQQLKEAEARLASVFERQEKEESNLVAAAVDSSTLTYRLRKETSEQHPDLVAGRSPVSEDGHGLEAPIGPTASLSPEATKRNGGECRPGSPPGQAAGPSAGGSIFASTDKLHEYTDNNGQKVIVVEYPKSPSIPSLMLAVEEMLGPKADDPSAPHRQVGWPTKDDCQKHAAYAETAANFSLPLAGFAEAVVDGRFVSRIPRNDAGWGTVMTKDLLRPEAMDAAAATAPAVNILSGDQARLLYDVTVEVNQTVPSPRYPSSLVTPAARGVDVRTLVDFSSPVEALAKQHGLAENPLAWPEPTCSVTERPENMDTLVHLSGVKRRAELRMAPERCLESVLQTMHDWHLPGPRRTVMPLREAGMRLALALRSNTTSWTLLNLAGLYWRVKGNASQAIECLRSAFFFAPPHHKDVALLGLGNVLHRALHSVDAITVIQMSIQIAPRLAVNHFTMGNILSALEGRADEEAAFFYESALSLDPSFSAAFHRLEFLQCKFSQHIDQSLLDRRTVVTPGEAAQQP
jgi:tetratricopeptide (TPR) repeat protein